MHIEPNYPRAKALGRELVGIAMDLWGHAAQEDRADGVRLKADIQSARETLEKLIELLWAGRA